MSQGSLARRYAKALMDIGLEKGTYNRLGQDLASLAKAMKDSEQLRGILSNPVFPRDEREKLVSAVLQRIGADQTLINFSKLLLDRERMVIIPDISRALSSMIDDKSGSLTAEVTSASALTPSQEAELKTTLESLSGKKVHIKAKEDPSLLGGVIAKVGDLVYDGSLKTQLQTLRRNLGH